MKEQTETESFRFLRPQHVVTYQHGVYGRCRLLLPASHGGLPGGEPLIVTHPPAQLGGGRLRHPVAQAHDAPHRTRRLQDLPRAVRQRNPAEAGEPGGQRSGHLHCNFF